MKPTALLPQRVIAWLATIRRMADLYDINTVPHNVEEERDSYLNRPTISMSINREKASLFHLQRRVPRLNPLEIRQKTIPRPSPVLNKLCPLVTIPTNSHQQQFS